MPGRMTLTWRVSHFGNSGVLSCIGALDSAILFWDAFPNSLVRSSVLYYLY
jgi:hypothetical protein